MALKDQYLNALSRDKRVLNITHFDMDGAASSIILGNVYQNIKYKYLRYDEVDSYLEKLNFSEYDIVIMTDISPTKAELIEDKNVFLLDHHDSALFLNCPEKNRIVRNGKSAALLVKEFFEHLFGIDLSELNEFCKVVNDYDMWVNKDPRGWCLNELYYKYWNDGFRNRFFHGDLNFSEDEKTFILERKRKFDEVFNALEIYDLDSISGCLTFAHEFINDVCSKLLKKYKIVLCLSPKSKNCSIRVNNPDVHIGQILKEFGFGGGHAQAGGMRGNDTQVFQQNVDFLEDVLYNRFKSMRK